MTYQLSTFSANRHTMVQRSRDTTNEGNINVEFVVPKQLSTCHEELVQNFKEMATSTSFDYHVDPTSAGILNKEE